MLRSVRMLLYAACGVAAISIVLALLVLSEVWGSNVLRLPLLDKLARESTATLSDIAGVVTAIGTISLAISTSLALIVGSLAVIAVVISQQAEFKTDEQLKIDVASLVSTLVCVRNRALLYTNPQLIDTSCDIFVEERNTIVRFLTSSSGFALFVTGTELSGGERSSLSSSLAGIADLLTLDLKTLKNHQSILNTIMIRSNAMAVELASVSTIRFNAMRHSLLYITSSLRQAGPVLEHDPLKGHTEDMSRQQMEAYRAPTEHEVAAVVAVASERIGGKAGATIEHFGRLAIAGAPEDRANFHKLVHDLLGMDLDDLGQ